MILLSSMTQFNQMTELGIFVLCSNGFEPQKELACLKVPWLCQGIVNRPPPSLVGVHTSVPGLSERIAITVYPLVIPCWAISNLWTWILFMARHVLDRVFILAIAIPIAFLTVVPTAGSRPFQVRIVAVSAFAFDVILTRLLIFFRCRSQERFRLIHSPYWGLPPLNFELRTAGYRHK